MPCNDCPPGNDCSTLGVSQVSEMDVKSKTPETFWNKIKFGQPDECWEWQADSIKHGYGRYSVHVNGTKNKAIKYLSTRFIFEKIFGSLNQSLHVLHKCDNPRCVNPNHLFTGTPMDNSNDKFEKGRQNFVRGSECKQSKLNESDVTSIKSELLNGCKASELARIYGVSKQVISKIKHNHTWMHVI